MSDKFRFELVLPDRLFLSGDATHVVVTGEDGDFGLLPGHAPIFSTMRPGILEVMFVGEDWRRVFVRGGFVEGRPDRVTVLAENAIPVEELDAGKMDQEIKYAEEDVANAFDDVDSARAREWLDHLKQIQATL